jgi:Domain of unknown function (DUF4394)
VDKPDRDPGPRGPSLGRSDRQRQGRTTRRLSHLPSARAAAAGLGVVRLGLGAVSGGTQTWSPGQPPNAGILNTVGYLRVTGDGRGGFDISADGMALAALTQPGSNRTQIYSVACAPAGPAHSVGAADQR